MAHPTPPLFQPSESFRTCGECGRAVHENESIMLAGTSVCANCKNTALAKLQSGQPIGDGTVWREKNTVVMGRRAALPERCVKCNAPAEGSLLKRQLYWHRGFWYLTILINILVYLIVAMAVRKTATVQVGLCETHRRARWRHIAIAWGLAVAAVAAFIVGAQEREFAALILVGVGLLITGLIWGVVGGRVVFATRIDDQWIRLKGAGQEFLDSLPTFPKPV